MTYDEIIHLLYTRNEFKSMKLGLEKIKNIIGEQPFEVVHIAGSNGKGSVATKVAAALEASGKKVGLFTSPHIKCFRERIRVNGEMISEEKVVEGIEPLLSSGATYFELVTALAFEHFRNQDIDIAVIEVGLGGRLDATNVVAPILSIITSISLDHTQILGDTVEAIANEKWGIAKPGVPMIIGPTVPTKDHHPLYQIEGPFDSVDDENSAIAKKACEVLKIAPIGIEKRPPYRREWVSAQLLYDVAHNPTALKELFKEIKGPKEVIFGMMKDKDISSSLKILNQNCDHIYFVTACPIRGMSAENLKKEAICCEIPQRKISSYNSIDEALMKSRLNNKLVIVTGSFYLFEKITI